MGDSEWTIYYDDLQEGTWFQHLDERMSSAELRPLGDALADPGTADVLQYDRPDVLLTHRGTPVLVIERTIEVPSGHNVGQRFARLAAAAEQRVPLVYFGPFKARKHGGATAGPRYMNLRLFYALDKIEQLNDAAVSTINWPVDDDCELLRTPAKDDQMREYLAALIDIVLVERDQRHIVSRIRETDIYRRLRDDRLAFEQTGVSRPEQYSGPPNSVRLLSGQEAAAEFGEPALARLTEIAAYRIGMTYIRSDPYTGMSMLYRYLYVLPHIDTRALILQLPAISRGAWDAAIHSGHLRKDVKLYRLVADAIQFSDGFRLRREL
jgi:hypothetical protein